jgi:hypothetical protein
VSRKKIVLDNCPEFINNYWHQIKKPAKISIFEIVQFKKSGPTDLVDSAICGKLWLPHYNQPDETYKIIWTADYLPIAFFYPS